MGYRRRSDSFQFEESPFSRSAEGSSIFQHEVLLLGKFLQNKLQFKSMNVKYYCLYNAVTKGRDGKKEEEKYVNVYDIYLIFLLR